MPNSPRLLQPFSSCLPSAVVLRILFAFACHSHRSPCLLFFAPPSAATSPNPSHLPLRRQLRMPFVVFLSLLLSFPSMLSSHVIRMEFLLLTTFLGGDPSLIIEPPLLQPPVCGLQSLSPRLTLRFTPPHLEFLPPCRGVNPPGSSITHPSRQLSIRPSLQLPRRWPIPDPGVFHQGPPHLLNLRP